MQVRPKRGRVFAEVDGVPGVPVVVVNETVAAKFWPGAEALGKRLRMAIGASRSDVARLIFAQGIRPLAPGLAIRLLLALAATRLLRVALVGVSPRDPLTFVAIVGVLTVAALLGCLALARGALRVDPVVALRCN
jgi:hypothetical protein